MPSTQLLVPLPQFSGVPRAPSIYNKILANVNFSAKKQFCSFQSRKKGQTQVLLKYLQVLNKKQTLVIKMATLHK